MDGRPYCKKRSRGSLVVRSRQIRSVNVGGGEKMAVYIYCHRHIDFLRSTVAGERFKWHTTEHTKMARWQKPNKPLLRSIGYLGTDCLHCVAFPCLLSSFCLSVCMVEEINSTDTHLQYPDSIAKIVNGGKGRGCLLVTSAPDSIEKTNVTARFLASHEICEICAPEKYKKGVNRADGS